MSALQNKTTNFINTTNSSIIQPNTECYNRNIFIKEKYSRRNNDNNGNNNNNNKDNSYNNIICYLSKSEFKVISVNPTDPNKRKHCRKFYTKVIALKTRQAKIVHRD